MGIGYNTDAGKAFHDKLLELALWAWDEYYHPTSYETNEGIIYIIMYAMNLVGMTYEMERSGMR